MIRFRLLVLACAASLAAEFTDQFSPSAALDALAKKSVSQVDGSIGVGGITSAVDVVRDQWGVLHIYAQSTQDLYFAQGFSGHGVIATGLAGKLVSESIRGQSERLDLFARIRHLPFPGGRALRTPMLVAAMAWYKLRDALW